MKWLYNTGAILFMVCYLASCSDYLEVEHNFKDRLTIEKSVYEQGLYGFVAFQHLFISQRPKSGYWWKRECAD